MSTYDTSNDSSHKSSYYVDSHDNDNEETTTVYDDEEYGDVSNTKKMYENETLPMQDDQEGPVNSLFADLSCLCVPTCATKPKEMGSRIGKWFLGNSDQFISSTIGEYRLLSSTYTYHTLNITHIMYLLLNFSSSL